MKKTKHDFKKKASAFTLAEVLITLGIIGIVAAITIPTLYNQSQEKKYRESAKVAYSIISQAVLSYQSQENPDLNSEYTGNFGSKFYNNIKPYFNIINDCGGSCVGYNVTSQVYTTLNNNPATDTLYNIGGFVLKNGMTLLFDDATLLFHVDVNGHKNKPNKYGVDFFVFELSKNDFVVRPVGADTTLYTNPQAYCNKTTTSAVNGYTCSYYVMNGLDY